MAEPKDMRFYCSSGDAEPVGPMADHSAYGRPRNSYSLVEAVRHTGWPVMALIRLFHATYPHAAIGGDYDPRLSDLAEALWYPEVRDAALHFYGRCGTLPAATFLRALLIQWDMSDEENKAQTIIEATGVKATVPRSWFHDGRDGEADAGKDGER